MTATAFAMSSCGILQELADTLDESVSQTETQVTTSPAKERTPVETSYGFDNLSDKSLEELYYMIDEYTYNRRPLEFKIEGVYTDKQIFETLEAYKNDHPEKFWIKTSYSYYHYQDDTQVYVDYNMSRDKLDMAKKQFDTAVNKIVSQAPKNASDFELELYIHDYLIENCEYDYEASQTENIMANENDAYGALVDKKAVCEGYARAFQLLCRELGIDCINVTGSSQDELHQWNCIKLDDDWYYVDVTWDDSDGEALCREHNFMNLSTEQLTQTHKISPLFKDISEEEYNSTKDKSDIYYNVFVPECMSEDYNYFIQTCIVIDDIYNSDEIKKSIAQAAANGEKYYDFIISDELDYDAVYEQLLEGHLYEWIEDANDINNYDPELNPACLVYKNEAHNVVNIEFEYINQ